MEIGNRKSEICLIGLGSYFERGYAQRWGLPPASDEIRRQVSGLWEHLHLTPSSRVVDIGCGHGRHALALAQGGPHVVGVDSAAALLTQARRLAADIGVQARWVRGDMRRLPVLSACFDAAILMDAFGFFETEIETERVAAEAVRVLRPRGTTCVESRELAASFSLVFATAIAKSATVRSRRSRARSHWRHLG